MHLRSSSCSSQCDTGDLEADGMRFLRCRIVTRCSGDMRGTVEALLLVNEHLELKLNRVYAVAAFGARTERRAICKLH